MNRGIYEGSMRLEDSVIDQNDYLVIKKKARLIDRILLSPIVKFVIPTIVAVGCLMIAVYLTMYFTMNNSKDIWPSTCNIRASYRVDCFPGRKTVTYDECIDADCCWHDEIDFCFHSVPSRHGYTQKDNHDSYRENEVLVPRRTSSPFGRENVDSLTLKPVNYIDPNHIEIILKIGQTREKRNIHEGTFTALFGNERISTREVKTDELSDKLLYFLPRNPRRKTVKLQTDVKSNMDVYVHNPEFSVTVMRKNDTSSNPLLSTARGPLIMTKNFWELTLFVTNSSLYGLNQLELNGTTNWIYDNENVTSRLAFLGINDKGEGTTCYVSHEGPMEIKVLNESNLVVLRGITVPNEISLHVFAGPTPLEAIQQLTKALGDEIPNEHIELSSMGLHVCPNDNFEKIIDSMSKIVTSMKDNEAPWDSHCIHQDFDPTMGNSMDVNKISIVEKAMELLGIETEAKRMLVPHLSPMVFAHDNKLATKLFSSGLLLRNSSGYYIGSYRNRSVFYPDWHDKRVHDEALTYLRDYMNNYKNSKLLYLRDSWPRDETRGNPVPNYLDFDYLPRGLQELMSNGTVPYNLNTDSSVKSHYTQHNGYSSDFRNFTRKRGNSSTSLVIRGLWGESGNSSWSALRAAVRVGVGSSIVGQLPPPMYACGSGIELGPGENNDQLCSRWFGAAVAWPHVLALHANLPGGDHLTATSTSYITKHLRLRGSLVTYANTILAQYYRKGTPILAPTSVHYPNDLQARNRQDQFIWGYGILVGLVTLPRVSQVLMWIPGKHPWRHLNGGAEVYPTVTGITSITALEGHIVTLIRPGCIIPIHPKISMTSSTTVKQDLTLAINLSCDNGDCNAYGKIFYGSVVGDGEYLIMSVNETTLRLENVLAVKEIACNSDETKIQLQGTMIKDINILGYDVYSFNKNFCEINESTFEQKFK